MFLLEQRKNNEPLHFNSAEEMFDHIQTKWKNRTKFQKVLDFINYRIIYDYIHPLHPRRLYYRFKNILQKHYWGFNDYELMDLDSEFSNWIIPKLKNKNTNDASINKMIRAFELNNNMQDELNYTKPFNLEKYNQDTTRLNKEMFEGLHLFIHYFRENTALEYDVIENIVPRLKRFIKIVHSYPSGHFDENGLWIKEEVESLEHWQTILNNILNGFNNIQLLQTINVNDKILIDKMNDEINIGLNLFVTYFNNLWN